MSDTLPLPWIIKSVALFRIFSPPDPPPSPAGHLLLEVDDTGKTARSFRFKLTGTAHLTIDLPLSQLLPLPTVAAFTAHYHLPPDFLQLRDSRFSTDWFDFTDEVDRGHISITHNGTDAATPYLEAVRTADPSVGASLRWCVDAVDGEDLYLHLQHLPTALSNISGRPTFSRDTCPATDIAAFLLDVDWVDSGPLHGPRPVLFAHDPEVTMLGILQHPEIATNSVAHLLHCPPAREQLSAAQAAQFVAHPRETEVHFPFGTHHTIPAIIKPSGGTSQSTPTPDPSTLRYAPPSSSATGPTPATSRPPRGRHPVHNISVQKYAHHNLLANQILCCHPLANDLPTSMQTSHWSKLLRHLQMAALTCSTWSKYTSVLGKLQIFSTYTHTIIDWPLTTTLVNGFVLWCVSDGGLAAASVKTYLHCLSAIQQLLGLSPIQLFHSTANNLIQAAKNSPISTLRTRPCGTMTFAHLCRIRTGPNMTNEVCGLVLWLAFLGLSAWGNYSPPTHFTLTSILPFFGWTFLFREKIV